MVDNSDEALIKSVNLPNKPGVYMFKDKGGKIIYVGKSKMLNKRVSFYFNLKNFENTRDEILYGEKIKKLSLEIRDLDYIVTENEKEALILENDLIKRHQPKYNVMYKDDKSFPWIMITYSEKFPRILIVRQPHRFYKAGSDTKNRFFGPYVDVRSMKDTLKLLRKHFPYCSCKKPCTKKNRACINYQIKLCPAPCIEKISAKDYLENIKNIERVLSGDVEGIILELKKKMQCASQDLNFELAAKYRDKIGALSCMKEKQSIINYENGEKINRDIIGYYKTLKKIGVMIMHVREGRLVGKTPYIIDSGGKIGKDEEILVSYLEQYYLDTNRSVPEE
ncbi:MAG: excinuclease ABC subunit UvrC, partial [Promethearchaeota archaeon]